MSFSNYYERINDLIVGVSSLSELVRKTNYHQSRRLGLQHKVENGVLVLRKYNNKSRNYEFENDV